MNAFEQFGEGRIVVIPADFSQCEDIVAFDRDDVIYQPLRDEDALARARPTFENLVPAIIEKVAVVNSIYNFRQAREINGHR